MIKLVAIAGIRSQYMKLASMQRAVTTWNEDSQPRIELYSINAGQHYSDGLAGQYIDEYGVRFEADLTRSHRTKDPDKILSSMLWRLTTTLRCADCKTADAVIVFGDANTTLAGGLAAKRAGLPVIHIEAGLRTGRSTPEELNRVVVDRIADFLIASSWRDFANLINEGAQDRSVFAGDIVQDLIVRPVQIRSDRSRVLVTIHREENLFDEGLIERIFRACSLRQLPVLFLAHPRVLKAARGAAMSVLGDVEVRPSISHHEFLAAVVESRFVITDSGALQRESFYLSRRAIVVQEEPLWAGLTDAGIHRLSGSSLEDLTSALDWALRVAESPFPGYEDFGTRPVGAKILHEIANWIGGGPRATA